MVFARPDFWFIVDHLDATQRHRYDFLFHLAPDTVVTVNKDSTVHLLCENNGAQMLLLPVVGGKLNVKAVTGASAPIQGWYSEDHHKKCPAPTLNFHVEDERNMTAAWVLYPLPPGADSTVIQVSMMKSDTDDAFAFEVSNRALTHSISVSKPSLTAAAGEALNHADIVITNQAIGKSVKIQTN